MIKEDVLNALSALGFRPEEIEDYGYRIDYEGLPILIPDEEEETKTICFSVPCVFEVTPENELAVYKAMVELTGKMKFVQPVIMFDTQVWLTYQHYLGEQEVDQEVIAHMIRLLSFSTIHFHKLINEDE